MPRRPGGHGPLHLCRDAGMRMCAERGWSWIVGVAHEIAVPFLPAREDMLGRRGLAVMRDQPAIGAPSERIACLRKVTATS